jgi:hypothetical protein
MPTHRRVPAKELARIMIARWQRMARSTLAAQQRRADISREPAAAPSSAQTSMTVRRRGLN